MKAILIAVAVLLGIGFVYAEPVQKTEVALICFRTGEQTSGVNRICLYNCFGSAAAITVSIAVSCPLTINR
jgi:hypothetical protein